MIEFKLGLIADHAQLDASGKFYILGEFRYITTPKVPVRHGHCVVAARWTADLVEVRDRKSTIEMEIVDADANPVVPRSQELPLKFAPVGPAEQSKAHAQVVVNLDGIVFSKYGDYAIHFIVNGTHNGSVGFHLVQAPPTQD